MKRTARSPLRDVLARNLRRLRALRGWSQERLAHEAGLNRTYLSAVERSEQNMSLDNLHKLSLALATPAGVLLTEDGLGAASQVKDEQARPPRPRTRAGTDSTSRTAGHSGDDTSAPAAAADPVQAERPAARAAARRPRSQAKAPPGENS